MSELSMPKERKFEWELKPVSSVNWGVVENKTGQTCVVLEHSLLRGVTSEMIAWWFKHFGNLSVTLNDVEGYEGKRVSVYLLWHPSDHVSAQFKGNLGENNTAKAGAKILIQETMQYKKYDFKYPVNQELEIFYCENDGWGMGMKIPLIGNMMFLRISYKDVYKDGEIIGVHYHYEVVAGTNKQDPAAKAANKKLLSGYSSEFWEAWITHNTIEVGVFENFLPALYSQRNDVDNLQYAKSMNPITQEMVLQDQEGFDKDLFEERLKGFELSENAFDYQNGTGKSILG